MKVATAQVLSRTGRGMAPGKGVWPRQAAAASTAYKHTATSGGYKNEGAMLPPPLCRGWELVQALVMTRSDPIPTARQWGRGEAEAATWQVQR